MWLKFLILASFLFVGSHLASAGPLEDARSAYERKDYKTAFDLFLPLAKAGNKDAIAQLAFMYNFGLGIEKDDTKLVYWSRKCAEQGDGICQWFLALSLFRGEGVAKNESDGFKWALRAANKDVIPAQATVAAAYASGSFVRKDVVKAAVWYSLTASNPIHWGTLREDAIASHQKLANSMLPNQLAEATKLVDAWLKSHPRKK